MPNRIAALVTLLKADSTVAGMVAGRVFDQEIPDSHVSRMPRSCLVVRSAGGSQAIGQGYADYSDERIDVRHYAWTPSSAYELYLAVRDVLRSLHRVSVGDTVLHWCRPAGGPVSMREPATGWPGGAPDNTTHWPSVIASWQVLAADIAPVEVP